MSPEKRILFWKYSSIVGASLINFCGRPRYFWGNMAIYIMSYVIVRGQGTGSGSAIQASWFLLISISCWSLGLWASDLLVKVLTPRIIVVLGIACTTIFFIGSAFSAGLSWTAYTVIFGSMIGFGLGMYEGTLLNRYVLDWVDTNKGLSTSVFITSSAIGSIFVNLFTTWWTNPRNLTPVLDVSSGAQIFNQDEVLDKVQSLFIILGISMVTLQAIGFCLLKQKHNVVSSDASCVEGKESIKCQQGEARGERFDLTGRDESNGFEGDNRQGSNSQYVDGNLYQSNGVTKLDTANGYANMDEHSHRNDTPGVGDTPDDSSSDPDQHYTVTDMLKSRQFQTLWFAYFCLSHTSFISGVDYKIFGQVWIADDHFLTNLGIAISIAVTVFTFASGAIMDNASIKTTLMCECFSATFLCLAMYFTARINKWAYFVSCLSAKVLSEFFYISFIFIMYTIFGKSNLSRNIAMLSTGSIASAFVSSVVTEIFVTHLGWFYVYGWSALMSTISMVFVCDVF